MLVDLEAAVRRMHAVIGVLDEGLEHADAEELADTLNSLLGGGGGGGGGGPGGQVTPQIAGQVADISNGVGTVTADPATNSLLIQGSACSVASS